MAAVWVGNDKPKLAVGAGQRSMSYEVTGTGIGPTDQFSVQVPANLGTIVIREAFKVSGSGSTLALALGRAEDFALGDVNEIGHEGTAAARTYNDTSLRYRVDGPVPTIWIMPTPDSGNDNKVVIRLTFLEGAF